MLMAAGGLIVVGLAVGVVALCGVFAVARALISWFPMDAPGVQRTSTGPLARIAGHDRILAVGLAGW